MQSFFLFLMRRPLTVLALGLALSLLGWSVAENLEREVFPEVQVPRVTIQAECPGLSPEDVERRVTMPVEAAMASTPSVRCVRSSSGPGLAFVWVDFDWNADPNAARFAVFERLARVRGELPAEVECEISPSVSVSGEIALIALTAATTNGADMMTLRESAEFDLRRRLLAIPGIGEVTVMGGMLPEWRIEYEPQQLAAAGVGLDTLSDAVAATRTERPAGYLADAHGLEIPLVQHARADDRAALEQCALATADGAVLSLGEVANVRQAGAPRRGSASYDGVEAVVISVQKTPGGDTMALQRAIDDELDRFAATPAARGIAIHRDSYRPADFIAASVSGAGSVLRNAALVVIAVLIVVLARPRAIATVLAVAAMAALCALGVFPLFGLTLNVMTLGGLAVAAGDIVDAAIIFTEAIWRRLDENEGRLDRSTAIAAAAKSVLPGVLFSTLTIALVFTPVLLLTGLESRFFGPFAGAYLIIFTASFFAAAIFVPVLAKLVWRARRQHGERTPSRPPLLRLMLALYRPALAFAVRHPLPTLALAAGAGALAVKLAAGFGASFLPAMHEDVYNVIFALKPDTSLAESERTAENAAQRLLKIDGVESVTRRTGRAERDQHAEGVSSSEFVVRLKPDADADQVRSAIRQTLKAVPGAAVAVGYPIAHRIDSVLSGVSSEIAIDIYHETPARLREAVRRLLPLVESTPGAADVRADKEIPVTAWRIDYDPAALAALRMTMADAGGQVATALAGMTLGEVRNGFRRSAVVLRHARAESFTERELAQLELIAPDGSLVPLNAVANVYPEVSEALRLRENGRRKATIACNVGPGSNPGDLVATLRERLERPAAELGCSIAFGGSHAARTAAGRRLAVLGAALCVIVALLLRAALGEWRAAAIAFANVPFALAGGVFAVALAGGVVSVPSLVGFVTVAGFTLRNGILLVYRYRERLAAGEAPADAIRAGSEERMASILMTTLTTVVGLVPIVVAGGRTGGEVLAPIGIVQFGGILGATALSLVVIPALAALAFRPPRPCTAAVALALAALAPLAGCRSIAPKAPVDWQRAAEEWQNAVREVKLAGCRDAERLVLCGNPELLRRRLAAAGDEKAEEFAGLWDDPEFSADLLRIVQGGANPWLGGMGLSAALPLSGSRALAARAAHLYSRAERAAIVAAEREAELAAARAWHRLAAARDRLDAIEEFFADRRIRRERSAVETLLAAGEIDPAAAMSVRRRCHQLEHERMTAEAAVDEAAAELRALAGLHPDCRIDFDRRACTHHTSNLPEFTAAECASHPRVRAELARLEAEEAALAAEIRRQYPDLRLGPAYSREEGDDRIGLALALDLPLWNRNRRNIAKAESTRDVQYAAAIDAWREIVRGAARAAVRRQRVLNHPAPPPRLTATADSLNDAGELSSVDFLAERAEALDERLSEITWHHDALDADAECRYYQPERN